MEEPPPVNQTALAGRQSNQPCININTATAKELMQLAGVGEVMSEKIISHRKLHGPFRRPQDLIIIEGFSEKKYRAIAPLICVE
jgi:competence protein ComEA